jgi:hypothetical protein
VRAIKGGELTWERSTLNGNKTCVQHCHLETRKKKRLLAKPKRRWEITKVNLIAGEAGNSIQLTEVTITSHYLIFFLKKVIFVPVRDVKTWGKCRYKSTHS